MVFASISSLAVTGHTHLQDYRDLSQEHTTYLLVAMPELRTQEFLRHTLDTRSICDGSIGRSIFCGAMLSVQFAHLPAIGLSVCKTLTFATEYDKIKAGRDDASGVASPLCIKSYQRGTGRQPFARWMAALLFATFSG